MNQLNLTVLTYFINQLGQFLLQIKVLLNIDNLWFLKQLKTDF